MNDEMIDALLSNRSFLYSLASRVFAAEPDEAVLSIVADLHTREECALLDDEECAGACLYDELAAAAAEAGVSRLTGDYTKLFIGPDKLVSPPWESVHVCGEPLLFQASTLAVRESYQAAGYRAAGYPHEPDDHLGTELGFMAALAASVCDAQAAGEPQRVGELLATQRCFLDEHLLAWVPGFADGLAEAPASNGVSCFYPLFARLAVLVCKRDRGLIEELLEQL